MGWLGGVHFASADDVYEFMQDVQQRKLLESPQILFYGMCPTLMVIEKQGISQLKSSTFDQNFCYFPSVRCLPSRFSLTDPGSAK